MKTLLLFTSFLYLCARNMNDMNKKLQAHSAIFFANTIFGLGVPVTKLLLDEWVTPMGYMASRSLGACILFWIIAAFMPKEHVERKDLITILFGGLLGFVISQSLTAWALDYTSPVYFSLIATLTPVAVMLCAALTIGEKITPMKSLGVLLGIAGAVLMVLMSQSLGSGKNDLIGISLAILSVLTWAIYLIITRNVASKYSPVTQMKYVFLISAIVTVPIAIPELPVNALYMAAWGWDGVLEMAFIVICATALGFFLIPAGYNGLYLHQSPASHSLVCRYSTGTRHPHVGQTRGRCPRSSQCLHRYCCHCKGKIRII